jgi:hypothetical protein
MKNKKHREKLSESEIDEVVSREAEDSEAWEPPILVVRQPKKEQLHLDLAAKHFVLSVLHRLGAAASLTEGPESVDITLVRRPGDVVTIDVKAAAAFRSWTLGEFSSQAGHYVVFVKFPKASKRPSATPEIYIAASKTVEAFARSHRGLLQLGKFIDSAADAHEAWDRLVPRRHTLERPNSEN